MPSPIDRQRICLGACIPLLVASRAHGDRLRFGGAGAEDHAPIRPGSADTPGRERSTDAGAPGGCFLRGRRDRRLLREGAPTIPTTKAHTPIAIRRTLMFPPQDRARLTSPAPVNGQERQHLLEIDPRCAFEEIRHDRGPLDTAHSDLRLGQGHRPVGVRRLQHQALRLVVSRPRLESSGRRSSRPPSRGSARRSSDPDRTWLQRGRAA